MQNIYESLGTIIGFSVLVILVQNFIGDKASESFVLITLLSMLLLNSTMVVSFFKSFN